MTRQPASGLGFWSLDLMLSRKQTVDSEKPPEKNFAENIQNELLQSHITTAGPLTALFGSVQFLQIDSKHALMSVRAAQRVELMEPKVASNIFTVCLLSCCSWKPQSGDF